MPVKWDNRKMTGWQKKLERQSALVTTPDSRLYMGLQALADKSTTENFLVKGRPLGWKPRKHENLYWWPCLQKTMKMKFKTLASIRKGFRKSGKLMNLKIISTYYSVYHQYGEYDMHRPFVVLQVAELKRFGEYVIDLFQRA